ncbi:MAG: hypothetical protein ABIL70_09590 [candidate division WOR-3 bacterium]
MVGLGVVILFLIGDEFPICTYTGEQYFPTAIAGDSQYYVFWSDYRYYSSDSSYAIFGARISNTGTVLDPDGKILFRGQSAHQAKVACDGTNFLVVFRDSC